MNGLCLAVSVRICFQKFSPSFIRIRGSLDDFEF